MENVALILGGGIGVRFGSSLPKQYHKVKGHPVIDYVIDACERASLVDHIVVVCDQQAAALSPKLQSGTVEIVPPGSERLLSLENGLRYIQHHYDCGKVCIFDAVAPLVYPALINDYLAKLDDYDMVITCQKITGELGNYEYDTLNRNDYYITQSPESFRFPLLMEHFDPHFASTELANHFPKATKRYLNFDFPQNHKLTYDFDLKYIENMIAAFRGDAFCQNDSTP